MSEKKTAKKPKKSYQEKYEALKKEYGVAQSQSQTYLDHLKHLKADFENYKKRMLKEQTYFLERASQELIQKLLPILDNLERALSHRGNSPNASGIIEGVAMVQAHLKELLEKEGLEEINPVGEVFDPAKHEAVARSKGEKDQDNRVVEVLQKGYLLKGKVIRPALVKVAQHGG